MYVPSTFAQTDPAVLVLEDGTRHVGRAYGALGTTIGEVVFATGMTGYQETLTDPSYAGQIVLQTAPHIGNTGMNDEDPESRRIWVSGYIVRDPSRVVSNWRADESLDDALVNDGVVGISGIDTRAVTRHIRSAGSMRGAIVGALIVGLMALAIGAAAIASDYLLDLGQWHATAQYLVRRPAPLLGAGAAFGMTLGDLAFDDLSIYPRLNRMVGRLGVPWWTIGGNHDLDYEAPDAARSPVSRKSQLPSPRSMMRRLIYPKLSLIRCVRLSRACWPRTRRSASRMRRRCCWRWISCRRRSR